jgi:acetyltransferase-like isoleucine patch superfamily enzyme
MITIPYRIYWQLIYRNILAKRIQGFYAHIETYASKNCVFSEYNHLYRHTWLQDVLVGKYTYFSGVRSGYCEIGAFCSIGHDAIVGGLGTHPIKYISTHPAFYSDSKQAGITFNSIQFTEMKTTIIGNDVWIGARSMILDGVNIGDGAIVAAGAIVTSDIPPYAIVKGIPAKVTGYRFSDPIIQELESWQWWNLPSNTLKKISPMFTIKNDWTVSDIRQMKSMCVDLK